MSGWALPVGDEIRERIERGQPLRRALERSCQTAQARESGASDRNDTVAAVPLDMAPHDRDALAQARHAQRGRPRNHRAPVLTTAGSRYQAYVAAAASVYVVALPVGDLDQRDDLDQRGDPGQRNVDRPVTVALALASVAASVARAAGSRPLDRRIEAAPTEVALVFYVLDRDNRNCRL